MDIAETLPCGNLLLTPIRVDTVTRNRSRALVFAETERKFFGCFYAGDVHGWKTIEWYKPGGQYRETGNSSPLDLNLTAKGVQKQYETSQRQAEGETYATTDS